MIFRIMPRILVYHDSLAARVRLGRQRSRPYTPKGRNQTVPAGDQMAMKLFSRTKLHLHFVSTV